MHCQNNLYAHLVVGFCQSYFIASIKGFSGVITITVQLWNLQAIILFNFTFKCCLKRINTFIQQLCINWLKVTVKILIQIHVVLLIFLFIKESWKKYVKFYTAQQLLLPLIIIGNVSWAPIQYIRMISEGSCDSELCNGLMAAQNLSSLKYIYFLNLLKTEKLL